MRDEEGARGLLTEDMEIENIESNEWEGIKEDQRTNRRPFLIIKGINRKRAIQMGNIQNMLGGLFVWEELRKSQINSGAYAISKIPCAIGDTRIWSNSGRFMACLREVMEKHREVSGDGPLTSKT